MFVVDDSESIAVCVKIVKMREILSIKLQQLS